MHGDHDHPHDHAHVHVIGGGAPVLDIGGDTGALLATLDASRAGTELFLRPEAAPQTTVHTGVWERHDGGTTRTVALFAELAVGAYRVLDAAGVPGLAVSIHGGQLATLDLRT